MRLVALFCTAALVAVAGAEAATSRGTLAGTVRRGPVSPVCVAEQPCDEPARGVTLVFWRNGAAAARVVTTAEGRYRVRLAAGSYSVRRLGSGATDRRLQPNRVRVYAGRLVHVALSIDTGIR